MKKSAFWLLIPMLFASFGCLKEDSIKEESAMHSLDATFEEINPETRVGFDLDDNAKFFWTKGDAIAIGTGDPLYKFTTEATTGSESATFTGDAAPKGYAIYPWASIDPRASKDPETGIDGTVLRYNFKKDYTYRTVDSDFFNKGMSVDVPMWAKVEEGSIHFKHLGGVIAFKFPEIGAGNDQVFTLTADKKISGTFKTDLSVTDLSVTDPNENEPTLVSEDTDNDSEKSVTIHFSLDQTRSAVFYVPVPVGTYTFTASLKSGDETLWENEYSGLKVKRKSIRYTEVTNHEVNAGASAEDDSNVKGAMEGSTKVELLSVNGEESIITIPKKAAVSAKEEHSLTISKIETNTQTLTITEEAEAGAGDSSIDKLTVKIPDNSLSSLIIDMPETTVTLAPNGNNIKLNEVTASTADNTLVVAKNLTITKLIVNKGNIRLQAGAKIDAIERGTENSNKVIVIYEGSKPEIDVDENKVEFRSAAYEAFMAGMKQSGNVTLTEDIKLTNIQTITIPAGVEITLDLGGHTISNTSNLSTGNFNLFDVRGKLTVKNGTITTKHLHNMGWGASTQIFNVTAGGILNIEDANCENLGGSDMAFVAHLNNWGEVTLNVDNSTLSSTYMAVRVFNSGNDMNNVRISNSELVGSNYSLWVHNYTIDDFGTQEKVEAHKLLLNLDIYNEKNNNTFTCAIAPVRLGFTNAILLDQYGKKIQQ